MVKIYTKHFKLLMDICTLYSPDLTRFLKKIPILKRFCKKKKLIQISDDYYTTFKKAHEYKNNGINARHLLKLINYRFKKNRVRSYLLGNEWWRSFLEASSCKDEGDNFTLSPLIENTRKLDYNLLEAYEWLHIYASLMRVGLFYPAYYIRELAVKKAIDKLYSEEASDSDIKMGISAIIDTGDIETARKWIHDKQQIQYFENFTSNCSFLIKILSNQDKSEFYYNNPGDNEYFNFINNKQVAIVGPAQSDIKNAPEIDSFDRVVRFNYWKSGVGCDSVYKGNKTNISYFNLEQGKYLLNKCNLINLKELEWFVFKSREHAHFFSQKQISDNVKCRFFKQVNNAIFNGTLNAIPNAIIDLLKFHPKKIKVFNADLMLTVKRVKDYNPQEFNLNSKIEMIERFCRASISHDPVAQYNVLNILWKQKLIEGDTRFNEVMQIGAKDYMKQLQNIYGGYV